MTDSAGLSAALPGHPSRIGRDGRYRSVTRRQGVAARGDHRHYAGQELTACSSVRLPAGCATVRALVLSGRAPGGSATRRSPPA